MKKQQVCFEVVMHDAVDKKRRQSEKWFAKENCTMLISLEAVRKPGN